MLDNFKDWVELNKDGYCPNEEHHKTKDVPKQTIDGKCATCKSHGLDSKWIHGVTKENYWYNDRVRTMWKTLLSKHKDASEHARPAGNSSYLASWIATLTRWATIYSAPEYTRRLAEEHLEFPMFAFGCIVLLLLSVAVYLYERHLQKSKRDAMQRGRTARPLRMPKNC